MARFAPSLVWRAVEQLVWPISQHERGVVASFALVLVGTVAVATGAEAGFGAYAARPAWLTPVIAVALLLACLYGPGLDAALSNRGRVPSSAPLSWPGLASLSWTAACAVFVVVESRALLALAPSLPHDHAPLPPSLLLGLNVGVTEELLFRMLLLAALLRAVALLKPTIGRHPVVLASCVLASAAAFALLHIVSGRYEATTELGAQYLLGGAALAVVYLRVGILAAVAAHATAATLLLVLP